MIPNTLDPLHIRVGVSACLLGQPVRYDGGHKRDHYIVDVLGEVFDLVPVCPETAIGMGTPRPPIRLVEGRTGIEARGVHDDTLDVTDKLIAFGGKTAGQLAGISGYLFKSKSPSCGMRQVELLITNGRSSNRATGLFARELMDAYPLLPVEDESRLSDAALCENWLERVFAYHRWQLLNRGQPGTSALLEFHSTHKLAIMAHGPQHYRALNRIVADAERLPIRTLYDNYGRGFMLALRYRATVKRHTHVLQHISSRLKQQLDPQARQEVRASIDAYRVGRLPRSVPINLLKHHVECQADDLMQRQVCLYANTHELHAGDNCQTA